MWQSIKLLTKLQLCNIWGLNQIRHGKDKKKKRQFILQATAYFVLSMLLILYTSIITYGLIMIGSEAIILPLFIISLSFLILFFDIYKASSIIFNHKTYETLITLPVSTSAIVISRFLSMYLQSVVITALLIIPVTFIYGIMLSVGISFYILMCLGIFFIPLLPITVATAIGALITAISSKMKHKNVVAIILSFIVIIIILVLPMFFSTDIIIDPDSIVLTKAFIQDIFLLIQNELYAIYPPAYWFTSGVIENNLLHFLLFVSLSVGVFIIMISLLQWKFRNISAALYSRGTTKSYKMQKLTTNSIPMALYKKELKLYFSSSVYVVNTSIIGLFSILIPVSLLFMEIEQIEQTMGIFNIQNIFPLIIAVLCNLTSTTTAAISIEGKQWWITQSLPITNTQLLNSKILINMTILIPCHIISAILLVLQLRFTFLGFLWLLLIPFVYISFSSVLGIILNSKFPKFDWEHEAEVVKQGMPVLLLMIFGIVSIILPFVGVLMFAEFVNLVMVITLLIMSLITLYLYRKIQTIDLRLIAEK